MLKGEDRPDIPQELRVVELEYKQKTKQEISKKKQQMKSNCCCFYI